MGRVPSDQQIPIPTSFEELRDTIDFLQTQLDEITEAVNTNFASAEPVDTLPDITADTSLPLRGRFVWLRATPDELHWYHNDGADALAKTQLV